MTIRKSTTKQDFERQVNEYLEVIESKHKTFYDSDVPRLGKTYGFHKLLDLSELKNSSLEIPEITAFYDLMKVSKQMFLKKLDNLSSSDTTNKLSSIEAEIKALKQKCFAKEDERDSISISRSVSAYRFNRIVVIIIGAMEIFFIASVLSFFGDNPILVFAIAVPLSFAIIKYFEFTTRYLRDTPEVPRWRKIALILGGIFIFIVVGIFRREQVRLSSMESGMQLSDIIYNPLIFTCLSALPAVATIFIVYAYYLSITETRLLERKKELTKEIEKCKNAIKVLNAEHGELSHQKGTLEHLDSTLNEYDSQLDAKINAFQKQSLAAFVREYLNNKPA